MTDFQSSPVSASALADRIEKASVVSLMEQHERPGPIWAMPLSDEQAALIVSALRGLAKTPDHTYRDTVRKVAAAREKRLADACAALRSIAEGNLGDASWQANYETIKQVARNALAASPDTSTDRGGK